MDASYICYMILKCVCVFVSVLTQRETDIKTDGKNIVKFEYHTRHILKFHVLSLFTNMIFETTIKLLG